MSKNIYLGIGFSVVAIGVSLFLMKYIKEEGRDDREALKTIDEMVKTGKITEKEAEKKKSDFFKKLVEEPVEKPLVKKPVVKQYDSDDDDDYLNDLKKDPKKVEEIEDDDIPHRGGKRSKSKKSKSKKSKSMRSNKKRSKSKY